MSFWNLLGGEFGNSFAAFCFIVHLGYYSQWLILTMVSTHHDIYSPRYLLTMISTYQDIYSPCFLLTMISTYHDIYSPWYLLTMVSTHHGIYSPRYPLTTYNSKLCFLTQLNSTSKDILIQISKFFKTFNPHIIFSKLKF